MLGEFLALVVTPADEQDRAQVADLAEAVQAVTGGYGRVSLCGSGLHQGGCRSGSGWLRHPTRGGQAARGTTGVRALAPALGGRALVLLAEPVSAAGQGV